MVGLFISILIITGIVGVLGVLEAATLDGLELDYKKHSLFYKHIVKRIYNVDEGD